MFIPSVNVLNRDLNKKLYAYDVNSLYPYMMLKNACPIGDASYIEIPEERGDPNRKLSLYGLSGAEYPRPGFALFEDL
jgi:DNA polymerase type B, organellar and viral